jgi:hypothetical protein
VHSDFPNALYETTRTGSNPYCVNNCAGEEEEEEEEEKKKKKKTTTTMTIYVYVKTVVFLNMHVKETLQ